jgi:hypothetical protein
LTVAVLALSVASAAAQRPNCKDTYTHYSAPGQVDQGTTVALPNGGFQTTYLDGWTHTSEPDSSYGAGGRQMSEKDNTGRVRTVTKCDPKNMARQETDSEYQNGLIIMTVTTWNASGVQINKDIKRMTAAAPPPTPQGPQAQPVQPPPPPGYPAAGGPPSSADQTMNGPPPGYDQGPNGPPPPPGYDAGGPPPTGPPIGIGGFGFGFGFGTGHKP